MIKIKNAKIFRKIKNNKRFIKNNIRIFNIKSTKLLDKKLENIDISEIIKFDPVLVVNNEIELNEQKTFEICVEYAKLENMKWLLQYDNILLHVYIFI